MTLKLSRILTLLLGVVLVQMVQGAVVFGPFDAEARGGGPGHVAWFNGTPPTEPEMPWSLAAWVKPTAAITARTLVAGIGEGLDFSGAERFFAADTNGWFFFVGSQLVESGKNRYPYADALDPEQVKGGSFSTKCSVATDRWQHLAATYDGKTLRLFVNGTPQGVFELPLGRAAMLLRVGPASPWSDGASFAGRVAGLTVWDQVLPADKIKALAADSSDLDHRIFAPAPAGETPDDRDVTKYKGHRSALHPQKPSDLPGPRPEMPKLVRVPKLSPRPVSTPSADGQLVLDRGWELAEANGLAVSPEVISKLGFDTSGWYDATVPGTVLTTLVRQGIYPDPLYGLNNLLIPDELSRKSWWYRIEFQTPAGWSNRSVELLFNGINFHAETWLNGCRLGEVTGAFMRGRFDVASRLAPAGQRNVLAVRVWPQPHNGATHEESTRTHYGPNGADGTLDGPSFICSEGWDWIPTIRDRNTGIWQSVVLRPAGDVTIDDPQIVTTLPRQPDLSLAEVDVSAELRNAASSPRNVVLSGTLAGKNFSLPVSLAPGETRHVTFPKISIEKPALWWPNTYGEPTLHDLDIVVRDDKGAESDHLHRRVGLRTVTAKLVPHLVLEINGRRVFAKGGNWGMDDAMKDAPRSRLEPWIRLHREANLTIIRNWVGQSTSRDFYELCDQYGIMVWNDFWLATIGADMPASETTWLMSNAADTVKRYRAHPSIVLWCARNEGMPPPWIASRLEKLLNDLDGTRPYVPSSYEGPVRGLGPYGPANLKDYFGMATKKPFTTELGVDSVPTADALRTAMPAESLWPLCDTWAYLDAHSLTKSGYYKSVKLEYGQASGFDDFVRRAQMMNYVLHRAMFEGWFSRLWNPASGVMLWMSHPARMSTIWQLYSHDSDTHASYYAAKKACEPVHVQWNALDDTVGVVNTRSTPIPGARITLRRFLPDGRELENRTLSVNAKADAITEAGKIIWWPDLPAASSVANNTNVTSAPAPADPVKILRFELRDAEGLLLSENTYWQSFKPENLRALDQMPLVTLAGTLKVDSSRPEAVAAVELVNPSKQIALMAHLVLRDLATKQRILPAYWSDNYVSFLPGERRTLTVRFSLPSTSTSTVVSLDGWNISPASFSQISKRNDE